MNRAEIEGAERVSNLKREQADKANAILESEVFRDAVESLTEKYRKELREVSVENVPLLQAAKLRMDLLEDVVTALGRTMKQGKAAVHELNILSGKRERLN